MDRIERYEGAGRDTEFREQRLGGRDFVGFLGDVDVGQHQDVSVANALSWAFRIFPSRRSGPDRPEDIL